MKVLSLEIDQTELVDHAVVVDLLGNIVKEGVVTPPGDFGARVT